MTVYPSILVFLFGTCPMLDFKSPRATVKMLLYAFSKSFPCCKFSYISLAICHKIGATWEPWIYQLGTLKLIHVWPGDWIVATDWVTSLLYPQKILFYLVSFWCKYLFVVNISSSSSVIYCLTFKYRWRLFIYFVYYVFQLYIFFFLTANPGNYNTWFKTNSGKPL